MLGNMDNERAAYIREEVNESLKSLADTMQRILHELVAIREIMESQR